MKKPTVFEVINAQIKKLNKEYSLYLRGKDFLRSDSHDLRPSQFINQMKALKDIKKLLRKAGIRK